MDRETREAFGNLAAALAIIARRQTEQGEMLAAIVRLLTPEEGERDGPTLDDRMVQLLTAVEATGTVTTAYLKNLSKAVVDLPLVTVQAIDDNLGPLAKERGNG